MNLLYATSFGLAGGVIGFVLYRWIEAKAPRNNTTERSLVLAASVILPVLLYMKHQAAPVVAGVYAALALVLIGTSVFDLRKQVIPHVVTLPGMAAGLVASTWLLPTGFRDSLSGLLVGAGILIFTTVVEALRKKEVGGGDWKLAAAIGSFLGGRRTIVAMFFAGLFGFVAGLVRLARRAPAEPTALGPYISAGALAAMLWN